MSKSALATRYQLHPSLDEMVAPETMSQLEARSVTSVSRQLWVPDESVSGSPFLRVETVGGDGERRRYVLKRTGYDRDLIMRDTDDRVCREMLVWQYGLLDRLPPEVGHPIVGAALDGDGWAILMRDVGDVFDPHTAWPAPGWEPLSLDDTAVLLDAMAALHQRYWGDPALLNPAVGLCTLPWLYSSFSPASAEREANHPSGRMLPMRVDGWNLLEEMVAPDLARRVRGLQHDLRPLCVALERYPWTFVHGDIKRHNVGLERGSQRGVVLLDWQFATRAPPSVDLAWFLSMFAGVLPIPLDEAIAQYRASLAMRLGDQFDERWWQPQLELGLLGQFLRHGHRWMYGATCDDRAVIREHYRALLAWWTERLRTGAVLL